MPNFPSLTQANTTNVDNPNDLVANARADIKDNIDNVNSIITTYDGLNLVATSQTQNFTAQQYFGLQTLSDSDSANTYEWDLGSAQTATITLDADSTLAAPSNQQAGATYILIVKQDGTGSHTLSFDSTYKFAQQQTPTITTAPNSIDILTFMSDGTNMLGIATQDFG
jgi:hypothetical protein